jgi:diguanylate cyclase (GGDEF)-like protein
MEAPPLTPNEPFRLNSLRRLQLLDTPIEERFERITRLAQQLLDVPIAAISLIDADRQWFKSIQGLPVTETARDVSFCGHTILGEGGLVVPDARTDPRFSDNPFVTSDPHIVFYAGRPLHGPDGGVVGTLCVIDRRPRHLDDKTISALQDLATMAERELSVMVMNTVQQDMITQIGADERKTLIDPLTRLWNRDGAFRLLETGLHAVDDGSAIMLADIDGFKDINASYGNPAGDEVLREVARRMLGVTREIDTIGRYADDTFILACGALATLDEAGTVAEAQRRKVEESVVECGRHAINPTISIGIAWQPAGAFVDTAASIKAAETALAHARRDGGNCYVVCDMSGESDAAAA